jgi:hypothetical protein
MIACVVWLYFRTPLSLHIGDKVLPMRISSTEPNQPDC